MGETNSARNRTLMRSVRPPASRSSTLENGGEAAEFFAA